MSTNYYLRRKPTVEEVNKLKCLADDTLNGTNFTEILRYVNELYGDADEYTYTNERNVIHIGKRSGGWKFLWCPNTRYEDGKIVSLYELTKKGITDIVMNDKYVVVNEYGEIIDKEEFLEMAFNWDTDGYDSVKYRLEKDNLNRWDESKFQEIFKELGYKFNYIWQSDFYSDGLRFSTSNDFS